MYLKSQLRKYVKSLFESQGLFNLDQLIFTFQNAYLLILYK